MIIIYKMKKMNIFKKLFRWIIWKSKGFVHVWLAAYEGTDGGNSPIIGGWIISSDHCDECV